MLPPLLTELRTPAVHALALPLVLSIAAKQAPDQFLTVTLPELQPLLSTVDGDALVMLLGHLPTMAALMPPASADSVVRTCVHCTARLRLPRDAGWACRGRCIYPGDRD